MPFTAFPVTTIGRNAANAAPAFSAVDAANGNTVPNNGSIVYIIKNGGGGSTVVTAVSVPDQNGRSGDIAITVPAAGTGVIASLDPGLFNQRSGDVGQVHITFSVGTTVTMAVVDAG